MPDYGYLPPGLRGWVAGDQRQRDITGQNIMQLGGLMNLQNQMELQPLQRQQLQQQLAGQEQQRGYLAQFASQLPEAERAKFLVAPGEYMKELNKRYVVGGALVGGAGGAPLYEAPREMKIGPAGQVYDPRAIQPGQVIADPNKPFQAGPQGGVVANLPYQQFELDKSARGAARQITNVNAYTPASEEAQRDFIKSTRTTFDQLKQAPVALESIDKAKTLIPSAKGFMGPGGETLLDAAKFLNNRVGTNINTEGVKNAEELRTRIFFNIMDNLKKMDAQPSQQQQQIMQEALGKLGTDPNALPQVLDAFADVIKGKVDLHNKEVRGAIQRGVKFPYDPIVTLQQPKRRASDKGNELFNAADAIIGGH